MSDLIKTEQNPLTIPAGEVYDFVRQKLEPIKQEERGKITAILDEAKAITEITTDEQYKAMVDVGKRLKKAVSASGDRLNEMKNKAHQVHKGFTSTVNEITEDTKEEETRLKKLGVAYVQEQDRKRKEEEARLQEIARKEAEEAQLKAAEEAEAAGNTEEAEAILSEETIAPPVILADDTPKESGVSMRSNWKFRIDDESLIPREFMMPNEKALKSHATSLKEKAKVAGVTFYNEPTQAWGS
jgi:hypothetical protein